MEIIDSRKIYSGPIFDLFQRTYRLPDGSEAPRDIIEHYGASVIIPVTDDGDLVMVRQYRPGSDSFMLEFPAGKLDSPDEDRQACALRELAEETGFRAKKIKPLLDMYPTAAYNTEKISLFLAEGLTPGEPSLDEGEFVEVEIHSAQKLLDMVMRGEISDMKTILGVLYYSNM